jgi:enamine deaminase RidA (YjgF/YER057c/UK114 family)
MTTRKAIHPVNPHTLYKEHGYSPAILSDDLLFVSGMVGARLDGTPEPDLAKQIDLAFSNLLGVLDAADCTFDDVVDVTMFLVKPEESLDLIIKAMKQVYREPLPNITAIGVTWLAGFFFEIKVIARIPHHARNTKAE